MGLGRTDQSERETGIAGAKDTTAVRALALLYAAGGCLAFLALALPHGPDMDADALAALATAGLVGSAALRALDRPVEAVLQLGVATGTILISFALLAGGAPGTEFGFMYVWVAFYAFYFFSRATAGLHLALLATGFGVVLAIEPTDAPYIAWPVAVGSLGVAGLVLSSLRDRTAVLVAQLEVAAGTDSLTGLLNRRAFLESCERDLSRGRRTGQAQSLLLCDIDRFKRVNDEFGHQRGDEVLRSLSAALSHTGRTSDFAGRLGGEEFALLLPDTDAAGAAAAAERACERARGLMAGDGVAVTVSIGVATFPQDGETLDALMHASDRALYAAKHAGRDRWLASDPFEGCEIATADGQVSAASAASRV